MPRYSDEYNPNASVTPSGGMPNDYLSVRANPNQFGAQEGEALQRTGQTLGQIGNQGMDIALQQQGMINESLVADAETQTNIAYGKINGEYSSLKGLAAVAAHDQAVQAVTQVRQKIASSLPNPAAQRAYNMVIARQEGYLIRNMGEYKATQIKQADLSSAQASAETTVEQMGDANIPEDQFNYLKGSLKYSVNRVVQNLGYMEGATQDPKTGEIIFPDTDQGKEAKAVYDNYINKYLGQGYENRALNLQAESVTKAMDFVQRNKDNMPKGTYGKLMARLNPSFQNEQARSGADKKSVDIDNEYNSYISGNTSDSIEDAKNTLSGLVPGVTFTSGFRTPEQNIKAKGADDSLHMSGQALDFTLPKGMTFEDVKSKLDQNGFKYSELLNYKNDPDHGDHVHVAWGDKSDASTSGSQGYISKADFINMNYSRYVDQARTEAEKLQPGNSVFADNYVSRVEQNMRDVINQQTRARAANQDMILSAIRKNDITNVDQLDQLQDPKLKDALDHWRMDDPNADTKLTNLITSRARGYSDGFGTNFYQNLSDGLSGKTSDSSSLLGLIKPQYGKNSPLTSQGYDVIKKEIDAAQTPQGSAFAHAEQQFLSQARQTVTGGFNSMLLHQKFEKFLAEVLPQIQAQRAAGKSSGDLFNEKSPDYIGKNLSAYTPTINEIISATSSGATVNHGVPSQPFDPSSIKTKDDLFKNVNKMSREEFDKQAVRLGLVAPSVSRPE